MSRLAPLPSPDDWTAEEDRLGFFGPDSVTWRIHGDPSYHVGGLRALMLQALHPVAMDGVARNSVGFKEDWWLRMSRTGQYMETITFGSRTEARRMAARVRGYHRKLSGVEETTGRAYRVDDPDLLLWVYATAVDSLLTTAQRAGVPLTDEDADRYVAEQVAAAQLIGVPLSTVPRTVAELDAYLEDVRPSLAAHTGRAQRRTQPLPAADERLGAGADAGPTRVGDARDPGLRDPAGVGSADVLDAGPGAHRCRGDGRAQGPADGAGGGAGAGAVVADRACRVRAVAEAPAA